MSDATRPAHAGSRDRRERLPRWTAALVTVLVHALLLLLAWLQPPVTVTSPQASESGGALAVTWIDRTLEPPPPPVTTPTPPVRAPRPASRVRSTVVDRADDPVPPEAEAATERTPEAPVPEPLPREPAPPPPETADEVRPDPPAATASASPRRPTYLQGQPPGMRLEDLAPARAGQGRSPAAGQGRARTASSAGTSLEVDGYQVYYELISEERLRAWRDQGISELFLPLPGTRRLMVCPLEVALRRGSGACRMVEPDAPELAAIGDARQVIFMQRVFRLGKPVWSGPGPYR